MLLLSRTEDVAVGLGLQSLLWGAPVLDQESFPAAASERGQPVEHPKWHQARALLAKAESTEFGPEAEALVAKAQELISRYSLERLLDSFADTRGSRNTVGQLSQALPVLRGHEARVSEVFDSMVPHTRGRAVNVTDYAGWAAGTAAGDVAQLSVTGRLARDVETG